MLLSVVLPVYKKEKIIAQDLAGIEKAVAEFCSDFEIIPVVDGSSEDHSLEEIRKLHSKRIRPLSYEKNMGKGYALRFGASKAKGDYIVFMDSGMEINPKGISMLWEHMKWYGADVIVGSKKHPASKVDYPLLRRITTWGYYFGIRLLFGFRVRDTQTGLKIFRREVLERVLPRLLVKRYAIDVEILAVAYYLGFRKIYEAPVDVSYKFDDFTHASSFKLIGNSVWKMIIDTLAVFYRLRIVRFYDDGNAANWPKDSFLSPD